MTIIETTYIFLYLTLGIFVGDLYFPLGVAWGMLYVLAIVMVGLIKKPIQSWMVGYIVILIVLGFLFSAESKSPDWVVVINRVLSAVVVFAAAFSVNRATERIHEIKKQTVG